MQISSNRSTWWCLRGTLWHGETNMREIYYGMHFSLFWWWTDNWEVSCECEWWSYRIKFFSTTYSLTVTITSTNLHFFFLQNRPSITSTSHPNILFLTKTVHICKKSVLMWTVAVIKTKLFSVDLVCPYRIFTWKEDCPLFPFNEWTLHPYQKQSNSNMRICVESLALLE